MANETVRLHVVLPKELVDRIDQFVGRRKRSAFFAEAVQAKLDRERLGAALAATIGYIASDAHPEWETPEMISAWVHDLRSADRESSDDELRRHG